MKKVFDAVQMVRKIRDAHYSETKGMSAQELIQFYRLGAKRFHARLKRSRQISV